MPNKDPEDVVDLVMKAKRRSGETWYTEMCAKLEDKYGENPSVYLEPADAKGGDTEKTTEGAADPDGSEETASEQSSQSDADTKSTGASLSEAAQALREKAGKSRKTRKKILTDYYGKHAPEKTAEDIDKIIAKREGKASGTEWFFKMCDKLTEKYGEDVFEFVTAAKDSDGPETSGDEVETASSEQTGSGERDQEKVDSSPSVPDRELSPREKLVEQLMATAQGIDDLEVLEELLKSTEKAAEESAQRAAEATKLAEEEAEAKAEEERLKAEEEAKAKAERKAAARARAEKAKAEAAERRAKEEAAEEAALELETFDPIDIDDESSMVLVDAEVIDWLDEQRLSDYTPQIVSYGGKLTELMRRIKSDDIAGFGMSKAESARLKKGLKKLRKDARAAAEAEKAEGAEGEEVGDDTEEVPNKEEGESQGSE